VKTSELGDELWARSKEQMERVAQDHLEPDRLDVAGLERLDHAPGGQRHEGGSSNLAVSEVQDSAPRKRI
jgi:hypothetical protein